MEILLYMVDNVDLILSRAGEHAILISIALGLAIATGVPIGIAITRHEPTAQVVLYVASIIITIPSIALFGLMIPVLSIFGQGIGAVPAIIAVLLYSQLPIIRNTYTAINNVDPALREAAMGVGMSSSQRLLRVELPLAVPVIMAGVRTAVVMNIGVMAIAAYIGAGGLGTFISRGISMTDPRLLVTGAVSVSLFAILADYALAKLQKRLTPKAMRT